MKNEKGQYAKPSQPSPPKQSINPKKKKEIQKTNPQKEIKKKSTHISPAVHHIELSSLDTSHIQVSNESLCAA